MTLSIIIPLIGAIALGATTIMQKIVLRKRKLNIKLYFSSEFLAITIVMIPLIFFFWKVDPLAYTIRNILILLGIIITSIIANLFIFYSMKWEKLTHIEPARLLEPLFVIFLAIGFSFIFGEELYERNSKVIIPAIISGLALIFSHLKKYHIKFNKYFIAAIIGSFFFAFELVSSKLILDFYSPISFYFIRSSIIVLISLFIFHPKFKKLEKKVKFEIILIGILAVIFRVIVYYGYIHLGVIFTTLLIMLGPVFIYLFAWKFLKEKLNWKNLVAAIIILFSILYATLS